MRRDSLFSSNLLGLLILNKTTIKWHHTQLTFCCWLCTWCVWEQIWWCVLSFTSTCLLLKTSLPLPYYSHLFIIVVIELLCDVENSIFLSSHYTCCSCISPPPPTDGRLASSWILLQMDLLLSSCFVKKRILQSSLTKTLATSISLSMPL
jgi:hypothetical protein